MRPRGSRSLRTTQLENDPLFFSLFLPISPPLPLSNQRHSPHSRPPVPDYRFNSQALAGFGIEDSPGREEVNQSSSRHSPPLFPFLRSTADGAVSVGGGDVIGGDRLSDLLRATRLRGGSASPSPVRYMQGITSFSLPFLVKLLIFFFTRSDFL